MAGGLVIFDKIAARAVAKAECLIYTTAADATSQLTRERLSSGLADLQV